MPPLGRQCDVAFALVVLIGNAGAYTTCYSGRSAFNGFLVPAVTINDGTVSPWRQ